VVFGREAAQFFEVSQIFIHVCLDRRVGGAGLNVDDLYIEDCSNNFPHLKHWRFWASQMSIRLATRLGNKR
jgi:hypothetical protein